MEKHILVTSISINVCFTTTPKALINIEIVSLSTAEGI
jgi:hypothetical protein